jgi:hypothetical protein
VFTDDGSYMLGLVEVPLAGGRPTTVLSWGLGFGGVAVDGTFIYWLKYAETGASLIRSCK